VSGGEEAPWSGAIPVAAGAPSVVHIPIPGAHRLAVALRTRDAKFAGTSTSTLFIQDPTGKKKLLRLDYGRNPTTNTVDYHWNQKGVYDRFGIPDHTVVGRGGRLAYHAARAYRWAGGTLLVVGAVLDGVSIVRADQPLRRATQVASAWALAWVGCKAGGYVGGGVGTAVAPGPGTAGGAILGCIVGGYGGYRVGERVGDVVYQWAEQTVFTPLPTAPVPTR
jgi:hypothetical protein